MVGMSNFWGMGGGWVVALAVLITLFWLAAKIMNRDNNSKHN